MVKVLNKYLFLVPAVIITVSIVILNSSSVAPTNGADSKWYIAIAEGHIHEVIKPFSGRFLHPFLAGQISHYFSTDVSHSFSLIAVISLFLFLAINCFLLSKAFWPWFLTVPLFLSPYFMEITREFFQPDIFYAFLTAIFFLLLFYKKEVLWLLTLFFLFLTRESTLLLGLVLSFFTFLRSRKRLFITTLLVVISSVLLIYYISNIGLPNAHNLNNLSYVFLKMPYNFMKNILGVQPWVNTLPNCEPIFKLNLPQWSSLGSINSIGLCGLDFSLPLKSISTLLTVFGIMPLVLFYLLFYKLKHIVSKYPDWLIIALLYGVSHYFIGPATTSGIQRIVGYGWPAFLLVAPFLVQMFFQIDKKFIIKFSCVQILIAWLPFVVTRTIGDTLSSVAIIILIALMGYWYIFHTLRCQVMEEKNVVFG